MMRNNKIGAFYRSMSNASSLATKPSGGMPANPFIRKSDGREDVCLNCDKKNCTGNCKKIKQAIKEAKENGRKD